jgi:hypothetical protein
MSPPPPPRLRVPRLLGVRSSAALQLSSSASRVVVLL